MSDSLPSEKGYKTSWKTGDMNVDFWKEVLVGKTIKDVEFDEIGMSALVLDDGQRLFINHKTHGAGCVYIKD
jgi:hypothetical protein